MKKNSGRIAALRQNQNSIFIVYSWDNEDHKNWVRRLGSDIIKLGYTIVLDQFENTNDPWEILINGLACNNVIIIASPALAWKLRQEPSPFGIFSESQVTDEVGLVLTTLNNKSKVVTLLRPTHWCLSSYPIIDFRDDQRYSEELESLNAFLGSTWHVEGVYTQEILFFVRDTTSTPGVAGRLISKHEASKMSSFDGIEFSSVYSY